MSTSSQQGLSTMSRNPAMQEVKRKHNGKKAKAVRMARITLLAMPKKVSPQPPHVAINVKASSRLPKPSRQNSISQSPKPGSKRPKKENVCPDRLAIDGEPPKSPQSCETAQAQIEQFKQQMHEYRGVGDGETSPEGIEESAIKEAEALQLLEMCGNISLQENRSETKPGSEVGLEIVSASSLEENDLSREKMIPPTVEDSIGPVNINRVGGGRGGGLKRRRSQRAAPVKQPRRENKQSGDKNPGTWQLLDGKPRPGRAARRHAARARLAFLAQPRNALQLQRGGAPGLTNQPLPQRQGRDAEEQQGNDAQLEPRPVAAVVFHESSPRPERLQGRDRRRHGAQPDRHFVRDNQPDMVAEVVVECIVHCYPSEVDLVIARAVLLYLSLGNLRDANRLWDSVKQRLSASSQEFPDSPLLHFVKFLLSTLERDALPLFKMLREKYKPSLDRDPSLDEYLDEVAERFYSGGKTSNINLEVL